MGYRGKLAERDAARALRSQGLTMPAIAERLGVSRSSVSLWTRDVPFQPPLRPERRAWTPDRRPSSLHLRKLAEIERLRAAGRQRIGRLDDQQFLIAGVALYAGEGAKTDGSVLFANSDPRIMRLFCSWLRYFFDIDERRLRVRLYLHQCLDLAASTVFWSSLTAVPFSQFIRPYRAVADPSIRSSKHVHGCSTVRYSCSRTHRAVMGLVEATLEADALPG
ncbi:MAG: hypothetical protein H0W56_05105 [Acidothermales bacterium]|jgi:transcriptional regulator with XRE-family HTH domain|nr:hypothetical protein [Acidothermales bacterium]